MHNETKLKHVKHETHGELKVKCHLHFTSLSSKVYCLSTCFRHLSEIIKASLFPRERTMNGNDN